MRLNRVKMRFLPIPPTILAIIRHSYQLLQLNHHSRETRLDLKVVVRKLNVVCVGFGAYSLKVTDGNVSPVVDFQYHAWVVGRNKLAVESRAVIDASAPGRNGIFLVAEIECEGRERNYYVRFYGFDFGKQEF